MMNAFRVSCPKPRLSGTVLLESSKSISNRALIIRSLCASPFEIKRISASDDTQVLERMLSSDYEKLHSGHAGSSYRFMVARACLGQREVILDCSKQLQRRPIGPLVKALQSLGADIQYLQKEGFPPLKVVPSKSFGLNVNEVSLQSGISSQYITALLLIAPVLPNGLSIHLEGDMVSTSYIRMTLALMKYFGINHTWEGSTIHVPHGNYEGKAFSVEGDWSAASYYYSMVALAESAEIHLDGIFAESIQGDAMVAGMYEQLGVETVFRDSGITISKKKSFETPKDFSYDFTLCPDLAQTVMVTLSGLGIKGKLSGLRTLRIKETDRIAAMQTELARVKTNLEVAEAKSDLQCILFGKAKWKDRANFSTYEDHRMAMAFSPLACLRPIVIKEPDVVSKSYPGFWKDVESIGVKIEQIKVKP